MGKVLGAGAKGSALFADNGVSYARVGISFYTWLKKLANKWLIFRELRREFDF